MQSVRNIKTIYILPWEDYVEKALLKTWLYESTNPFPSKIKAIDASSITRLVIQQNEEAIICDQNTNKLLMVILQN